MTELQKFYKEHHICIVCGQDDAVPGQLLCYYCRSKKRECNMKYYKKHSDEYKIKFKKYKKQRYYKLKSEGICVDCGKRKAFGDHTMCEYCLEKHRKDQEKAERKKGTMPRSEFGNGLYCSMCGKEVEKYGNKLCDSCYDKACKSLEKARSCLTKTEAFYKPFIFGKGYKNDTGS